MLIQLVTILLDYSLQSFSQRSVKWKSIKNIKCNLTLFWSIFKVGLLPSKKKNAFFPSMEALQGDGRCFLFRLKTSFCSQDI